LSWRDINPDSTTFQTEIEYKLRQEKKRLFTNLSDGDKLNFNLYIKGKSIYKYDKLNKVHSIYKESNDDEKILTSILHDYHFHWVNQLSILSLE